MAKDNTQAKLWGGRFAASTATEVEAYTESVSFDQALWEEDIAGSIAHARNLARAGVLSEEELAVIETGLLSISQEIGSGEFVWRTDLEDVHMNIEARLTEMIGETGKKLHTGRSRNDQVCLDFRLHVRRRLGDWRAALKGLIASLAAQAEAHQEALLPGYTHMQPAQPVSLAQHLLAYAWMFKRDFERMADADKRVAVSPLGAAALAGTTYPLVPENAAKDLDLPATFDNSMDAVADRDFVLEAVFCASTTMMHLSRLCEEIILWANPGFGFIKLPDAYATGSSIMPQKKNPDVAELMRGKTGRVYGDLTALLTIMKGLPMTYNRDLQEDKEPFLDADKTVRASVSIMADMVAALTFNTERMREALAAGFLNATELADYLVAKGVPFREAHHASGAAVAYAEAQGKGLEELALDVLKRFSPLIEDDVFTALDYETAVARRAAPGSTGPDSVTKQISRLKVWLLQR